MMLRELSPTTKITLAAVAIAVLAGGIGYGLARLQTSDATQAATADGGEREALYWYDPMFPQQRFDRPGKSPFMDMQLVPRYADEAAGSAGVRIDPALTQNLGVRLATVQHGTLEQSLVATGVVEFNERDIAIVQARSGGFVERTYRSAPGDVVRAGAPLADLYVSDWSGAQSEFLALVRTGEADLIEAGRQRLRLLGMPPELIAAIERSGRAQPIVTIRTPIAGVIQTLNVRPGMTLDEGATLAEINGLDRVWLSAAVPESQAGMVAVGQSATAQITAYPGEAFAGRVIAILPEAQRESRTVEVRLELPNRGGRLRPGLFASVRFVSGAARTALLVPAEAVIRTGRRNLVMVALDNGQYQPAEVQIGREAEGQIEILAGLREGERVVASGQFLIDSEATLAGVEVRPLQQSAAPTATAANAPAGAPVHQSRGRIEALSAQSVTLSHEPVPSIGWPAMRMSFRLGSSELVRGLKVGDEVMFGFQQTEAGPVVRRMAKTASTP